MTTPPPKYWRSLEEYEAHEAHDGHNSSAEFPPGADTPDEGWSRRNFLQLLGASAALAGGVAGCKDMPEKILPYSRQPEDVIPGKPLHYATAAVLGGHSLGLLVEAHEGRPTKIEGNPEHPINQGTAGVLEQALILGLYDPQRARTIKQRGMPKAPLSFWQSIKDLSRRLKRENGGERLRFLVEPSASPVLGHLRQQILAELPNARFYSWAPLAEDNAYQGAALAFERPLQPLYDFSKAAVVLSLDCDFLGGASAHLQHMRQFSQRREPASMSRLYVAESALSLTGAFADHRLRVKSAEVQDFALALLGEVSRLRAAENPALTRFGESFKGRPSNARWVAAVAKDLTAHAGDSLVVAGTRQPPVVHAVAHLLNALLNNVHKSVTFGTPQLHDTQCGPAGIRALVDEIAAGKVDTLVMTAFNPVYNAPAELGFASALAKVPNSIYFGLYEDETAPAATWFVPALHGLEQWGDCRAVDGTVSLIQPLVNPLFSGVGPLEFFAGFIGQGDRTGYDLLREFWRGQAGVTGVLPGAFDRFWEKALRDGVIARAAAPGERAVPSWDRAIAAVVEAASARKPSAGTELNFLADSKVYDGRFANNPWLQELPEPLCKTTWDNAALIGPTTAAKIGVKTGDIVELSFALTATTRSSVRAPIWILPGHADDSVSLPLGYGRDGSEAIARNVGFNAYALRTSDAFWFGDGLEITRTGQHHEFAQTQVHWSMESRPLALEATVAEYKKGFKELEEMRKEHPSMYTPPPPHDGYRWAMTIDLNKCTGCSACVIACQAENNIPVVGKERIANAREMHWIRIDRYFSGPPEAPKMITQPVACVHCENAPCEYVCPVNATVHNEEGLNEMVYNRCVGTRYCSNNCPYKVRRFNFFDYRAGRTETQKMAMNPDVTVRSRGVMEKCTYCVQRIERARIETRIAGRNIKDGELQTACQQSCPAQAIVFGSLHDPNSDVSRSRQNPRAYALLGDLNTRPRTSHLGRVKNPNPELA